MYETAKVVSKLSKKRNLKVSDNYFNKLVIKSIVLVTDKKFAKKIVMIQI